jgi:hypothetical protein
MHPASDVAQGVRQLRCPITGTAVAAKRFDFFTLPFRTFD